MDISKSRRSKRKWFSSSQHVQLTSLKSYWYFWTIAQWNGCILWTMIQGKSKAVIETNYYLNYFHRLKHPCKWLINCLYGNNARCGRHLCDGSQWPPTPGIHGLVSSPPLDCGLNLALLLTSRVWQSDGMSFLEFTERRWLPCGVLSCTLHIHPLMEASCQIVRGPISGKELKKPPDNSQQGTESCNTHISDLESYPPRSSLLMSQHTYCNLMRDAESEAPS